MSQRTMRRGSRRGQSARPRAGESRSSPFRPSIHTKSFIDQISTKRRARAPITAIVLMIIVSQRLKWTCVSVRRRGTKATRDPHLLRSQRNQRIDTTRATRRNPRGDERQHDEHERSDDKDRRIAGRDVEEQAGHETCEPPRHTETDRGTSEGDAGPALQHHQPYAMCVGAQSHSNTDLSGSLLDDIGHQSVHTDRGQKHGAAAEEGHEPGIEPERSVFEWLWAPTHIAYG